MRHPSSHVHRATSGNRTRGFTVVELLAVIGTITVLLGLLLAGLQAARRSGRSTVAFNQLRQLHMASTAYTATNADRFMPGYVDDGVQSQWRLRYKYEGGGQVAARMARFYPWRILPYVDWSYETMLGYSSNSEIVEEVPLKGDANTISQIGIDVADNPWFGYNAYYVGGWWETSDSGAAVMKFANDTWAQSNGSGDAIETKGRLVVQTEGRATDPTTLVLFAGSTRRDPGIFREDSEFESGAAWVTPHILADTEIWNIFINASAGVDIGGYLASVSGGGSIFATPQLGSSLVLGQGTGVAVRVLERQAIPYRRVGATVAVVNMAGNTEGVSIGDLTDQRRFINAAHDGVQTPREFIHSSP